jgi:hypothetical protein
LDHSSASTAPGAQIYPRYRRWLPLWAAVAAVNLAIGAALTRDPQRASDLDTVRRWTARWLFDGVNLYASPLSGTDYPPNAIVGLSPIALLPDAALVPIWAGFNLLLAIAAPILAARLVRPAVASRDAAVLAILFLGWSGSKSLLQFTLLTLVLGLAGMTLADRRPRWSGLCLGLAMMKPQIGLPFVLWAVFARRWKAAIACGVVVAAASLIFCVRAGADPLHVATRYLQILRVYYAAAGSMIGISQVGPLVGRVVHGQASGWITAVLSMTLLAALCAEARAARSRQDLLWAVPALAAIWSLLTFYHLTYGFVLLLPAAALVLLADPLPADRLRQAVLWSTQVALVVDVPGLWRRFGPEPSGTVTAAVLQDWYRLGLLALFAAVWVLHRRVSARPAITV